MNFWQNLPTPFTVLAPMEGVTDQVFRQLICETARPHVFFTEFTNVEGICSKENKNTSRMLKFSESQRPIVAQLWGLDPSRFTEAAKKIVDMGFDGIDINFGCPVKKIIKKGACSAMIGNYSQVEKIIKSVKLGAPSLPISIKTRLGIDHIITDEWIRFLLTQDVQALTIHGRIAKQMSKGEVNWPEIAKAVNYRNSLSPDTKIIGNGDVSSHEDALDKSRDFGVDGIMIGRGVFENPWVFENPARSHSQQEFLDLLKKHLELYSKFYGNTGHYDSIKRYFKIYIREFSEAKSLRIKLMSSHSVQEAQNILSSFL